MARGVYLLLILSLVVSAYAHTYFSSISVDGVAFGEGDCVRAHPIGTANFPIPLVSAADMTCGFLPLGAQPANRKCPVQAGSKIAIQWNYASAAPGDIHLDSSHKGPTMVYMARSETGAGSVWFKVFERGLVNPSSNPQVWGTDEMIANNGKVEFTIPRDLAPGNYLIRGEVIALHGAYDLNGAQPYVGCAEVTVSGSGNAYPDTVALPGAYKNTDPGIYLSIYNGLTSYVIPGPRPYVEGTATNPAPPAAASSSASASSSSASSSSGTSATSSSTVPSTAGLSVYSDSLSTLFADYSWATQRNPQDSSYAYKGSFSYSFTPTGWQAVFLYCQNCIDTAKFESIEFWVNGGATGGQNVNFNLIEGSSFVQPDVSIATYTGGAIPANRWVKGTMKLSSFAAGTYDGIWFQDRSGSTQGTLYIDEIVLVPKSSSQKGNDAIDHSDLEHPTVDTKTESSTSSPFSKLILSNIVTFVGTLVVVGVIVASVYIYKKRKSSSQYQYNEFVENGRL